MSPVYTRQQQPTEKDNSPGTRRNTDVKSKHGKQTPTRTRYSASSSAVSNRSRTKILKYHPLVQRAEVQVETLNRRTTAPAFQPCVSSHRGEWSAGMFATIEWITLFRTKAARRDGTMDGETPQKTAAEFRSRLKDRLAAAMAKGWGRQLREAGFPNC